jgi:hypothetical protein
MLRGVDDRSRSSNRLEEEGTTLHPSLPALAGLGYRGGPLPFSEYTRSQFQRRNTMSVSKAGRIIGLGVIGVTVFGMALWLALGQPGIGLGHGIGSAFRDSDLDSNLPPVMGDYTECQGSCPGGYFDDNKELWVRTNPLDSCADTATANDEEDDKWPPDFNDDRYVGSLDLYAGFGGGKLNKCEEQQGYYQRSDLDADTCVDMDDYYIAAGFIGSTCQELFDDSDGDGVPDIHETEMGTDPNDDCGTDAWPPDINNDGYVTTAYDIYAYAGVINNCWPSSVYTDNVRLDMNADRCLDDTDVDIVAKYIGQQCTP